MRQTQCLSHAGWSVFRPLEWQLQRSATGHGSGPCAGFQGLCSQPASLSCKVPSSRTKGHFDLCIYTFWAWTMSAYTVETCWICRTERSWHVIFVFVYLVWNCQGESKLLIDTGFPAEREVMGNIIRPCTWSTGRLLVTWLGCTEIGEVAPKHNNGRKIAVEMQLFQKEVTTRVLFL